VPQMTNLGLKGKNGGLTIYYIPPYDGKTNVTAFKPVSLSRAGSLDVAGYAGSNAIVGISHDCWGSHAPFRKY
jgi:hypothetical protein